MQQLKKNSQQPFVLLYTIYTNKTNETDLLRKRPQISTTCFQTSQMFTVQEAKQYYYFLEMLMVKEQ